VKDLSFEEVRALLYGLKLSKYAPGFVRETVDGEQLLALSSTQDLMELGIHMPKLPFSKLFARLDDYRTIGVPTELLESGQRDYLQEIATVEANRAKKETAGFYSVAAPIDGSSGSSSSGGNSGSIASSEASKKEVAASAGSWRSSPYLAGWSSKSSVVHHGPSVSSGGGDVGGQPNGAPVIPSPVTTAAPRVTKPVAPKSPPRSGVRSFIDGSSFNP
jgi:SAM domain (Sterile alpha motif)